MIDEFSRDGLGWARFSNDNLLRYRIGAILHPGVLQYGGWRDFALFGYGGTVHAGTVKINNRMVFLMCNPSDANAAKPDPTWSRCIKFAQREDAWIVEAVNLHAFKSPYPEDLKNIAPEKRGIDALADAEILLACIGATRVVGAWGNHGVLDDRHLQVAKLLADAGVQLVHLGLTDSGQPKHPLARGKHRIPDDQPFAPLVTAPAPETP